MHILLLGVLVGLLPIGANGAPKPSVAIKDWQLDFDFHDFQRIRVTLPGETEPTTYWYLLYTVTNNSGQEVEFYPSFELVPSSLKVVVGGDDIHPAVYDAVKARHKKGYPFFRIPTKVNGKLLQGPDNARTSAAVFRDFDPEANSFRVFVAGLSGEIVRIANPAFDENKEESSKNPQSFILRKTLAILYDLPGDVNTRDAASAIRRGHEWVMR